MDKNNVIYLKRNMEPQKILKTPKISLCLEKEHGGDSIVYTLGKKRKNNPRKIARIKFDEDEIYDLLIINDLKIKKNGEMIFNSHKEKLDSADIKLKKIRKWFNDSEYKVKAMPNLLLIKNEMIVEALPICNLLEVEYTKNGIRTFVLELINYSKNSKEKRISE